jgi:GlpG protein
MWFQPMPRTELELRDWNPTGDIEKGEIWRLVTPIFIHFTPLHLFFDMYIFFIFGSMIESRRGTLRFALLVLALAVTSNFGQYFFEFETPLGRMPTTRFGGMSGVAYGLFGYLWMKSRFDPMSQLFLPPNTVIWLLVWYVLCWTGIFGSIANWAHTVGLVVGVVVGYLPVAWRQLRH